MLKKIIIALLIALPLTGCASNDTSVDSTTIDSNNYITQGRYYTDGRVITTDGNEWAYQTDAISDSPAYNSEPVYVVFSDEGTPENIYDDAIIGLVLDKETEIYDRLEDELSKEFTIERSDNNIRIIKAQ